MFKLLNITELNKLLDPQIYITNLYFRIIINNLCKINLCDISNELFSVKTKTKKLYHELIYYARIN